jgi:hypothetical protein
VRDCSTISRANARRALAVLALDRALARAIDERHQSEHADQQQHGGDHHLDDREAVLASGTGKARARRHQVEHRAQRLALEGAER